MRNARSRDPRGNIRRSTTVIRRHPSDLFLTVDHETKLGDIVELNVEIQALFYWKVEPLMAQGEFVSTDGRFADRVLARLVAKLTNKSGICRELTADDQHRFTLIHELHRIELRERLVEIRILRTFRFDMFAVALFVDFIDTPDDEPLENFFFGRSARQERCHRDRDCGEPMVSYPLHVFTDTHPRPKRLGLEVYFALLTEACY